MSHTARSRDRERTLLYISAATISKPVSQAGISTCSDKAWLETALVVPEMTGHLFSNPKVPMKIKRTAINDTLIDELLADPNFKVYADGTVWRRVHGVWRRTGIAQTEKNGKRYHHLKYKNRNLLVHRIVFRRFKGPLDQSMVVNHDDGNSLNNVPSNLDLMTQELNVLHCQSGWESAV